MSTGRGTARRRWYVGCSVLGMLRDLPLLPPAPRPAAATRANPHFARIGGRDAIVRLVDAFYRAMDSRSDATTIRAMHAADLATTRAVLVKYLVEWMGGPAQYTPERGPPRLNRRHQPFAIDGAARDAWMACMRQALAETCDDAALRGELDAAFARIADHLRNADTPSHHRSL